MRRTALWLIGAALTIPVLPVQAQQGDGTDVQVPVHVFKPNKIQPTSERVAALKAPSGFKVEVFAAGLKNARILAVSPDGTIYVSRRDQGDVIMLKDADGDGKPDAAPVVVASRAGAHGLAIHDGKLYLATVKEIFVADIKADGTLGELTMLVGDLPDGGQHPNRTLAFGPDGMLYITVGSTCNACNESNPESATVLRAAPDGKSRTIFASGLRNTIGLDWNPTTGDLWGLDHGIDFLGDQVQPEELNKIEKGKQYGWPHIWGDGGENPQSTPVGGITKQQWKDQSVPMTLGYEAHAAPMQMLFYRGISFPAEYNGDAFATMRGSWNRKPASGYEIVRIHFENGQPKAFEPFVTGFLTDDGMAHIARPVGLAVAKDGSLLMSDDANGVIYRIAYDRKPGDSAAAKTQVEAAATGTAAVDPAAETKKLPIALERPETDTKGSISVTSASFANGETLAPKYSEYADGVSPALTWSPVKGAVTYAIIAEDPDAKPITPFVHWLAYNIPADVTSLREGIQEQPRLTEPEGVLQGATSRGSVGYYGPRPPVGDPAHHYHFQVLALDTVLELPPGADRDTILAAAQGHVIAKGELVGLYRQETAPLK